MNGSLDFDWEGPNGATGAPAEQTSEGRIVNSTITFRAISTSQAGLYICTASLYGCIISYHNISSTLSVVVQSKLWLFHYSLQIHKNLFDSPLLSVPPPGVTIHPSHPPPYYSGTALNISCSIILDPNVNNNELVYISWSGLDHIPGDEYSITHALRRSANSYMSFLTISPLADGDDGTFTCTGTVMGNTTNQSASNSNDITINVKCKCV